MREPRCILQYIVLADGLALLVIFAGMGITWQGSRIYTRPPLEGLITANPYDCLQAFTQQNQPVSVEEIK